MNEEFDKTTYVTLINNQNIITYLQESTFTDEDGNIKMLYPSISKFVITDNILTYENITINLDHMHLSHMNPDFFKNSTSYIIDLLSVYSKYLVSKDIITNIKRRFAFLPTVLNLDDNIMKEIDEFVSDFYNLSILSKYLDEVREITEELQPILSSAYENPNDIRPSIIYLKECVINSMNKLNDEGNGRENAVVRIRNTGNGTTTLKKDEYYDKIAGFANSTILISLTVTLGITLAAIAIYLATR